MWQKILGKIKFFWFYWPRIINQNPTVFFIMLPFLGIISLIYGWVVRIRNKLYNESFLISFQPSNFVIGVGNLNMGGSGKTPVVNYLIEKLSKKSIKPIIIAKGYKGRYIKSKSSSIRTFCEVPSFLGEFNEEEFFLKKKLNIYSFNDFMEVARHELLQIETESGEIFKEEKYIERGKLSRFLGIMTEIYGDEVALYRYYWNRLNVYVGKKKSQVVEILDEQEQIKERATVMIVDDAFSHRSLECQLNILILLERDIFGSTHLLPLGSLREPYDQLLRADAIIIRGQKSIKESLTYLKMRLPLELTVALDQGSIPFFKGDMYPTRIEHFMSGKSIKAGEFSDENTLFLSAIANPSSFQASLRSMGIKTNQLQSFPDHYLIKYHDLTKIWDGKKRILVTAKDAVKLFRFSQILPFIYIFHSEFKITEGEDAFNELLNKHLNRFSLIKSLNDGSTI